MPPEGAEPRPQEGGVQFLSDELSEVGRNGQLTVQFLRADFATVSELSEKKSLLTSKNRRFVCVSAYIFFRNCCLSSSYPALFSAEYRKSSLRNWTPPRSAQKKIVKIGEAVPEMLADRQTDRQANCNTPLPYRGGVKTANSWKNRESNPSTDKSSYGFRALKWRYFLSRDALHSTSLPPLDNIRVMVIVWRLRGNIIRTALCWIVTRNANCKNGQYV